MRVAAFIVGFGLISCISLDVFKVVVLARRTWGEFRLTTLFYRYSWPVFVMVGRRIESGRRREAFLGTYGPLSLLMLFSFWALGFIVGFSLLRWSLVGHGFLDQLYHSAASFLTMGQGETAGLAKWITVAEAGLGFSFLGLVIGYLPVFYQSFARRELHISLLDARGGSPPTAAELLARQGEYARQLEHQLAAWEVWAADLLQDELSYPMLAYFRSQHLNQSWIGALVAMTDTSALVSLSATGELKHQAQATFAMARHALIDSSKVLGVEPGQTTSDRLSTAGLKRIRQIAKGTGTTLDPRLLHYERLAELRTLYEPYSKVLSDHLLMALPPWVPEEKPTDDWRLSSARHSQTVFAVSDPFHDEDNRSA
jgi:hypothetical protein